MLEVYCETLKELQRAIQNKRHGMLTPDIVLFHDNAYPYTVAHTCVPLEHFDWELFDHLSYSPDFSLSYCHLFIYLTNWLRSQHFNNNKELMEGAKACFSSQAPDFFDTGIQNLIPQYDKCLSSGCDYVGK
jgi:hypothetical protein